MTLRFIEGFDHLSVQTDYIGTGKWSSGGGDVFDANTISTSGTSRYGSPGNYARFRGGGFGSTAYIDKTNLPNMGASGGFVIVGFAFRPTNLNSFFSLLENGAEQLRFGFNASNQLQVWRGAGTTVLGAASSIFTANLWNYIEVKATIDPTTGAVEIRQNGVAVLTLTGQNTRATSNSRVNGIRIGFNSGASSASIFNDFDDLYVLDDAGSVNNTYLGERRIYTLFPSGSGTTTNFSIGGSSPAATNWQSVNQVTPDADITYVADSTPGDIDTYAFQDLPANVTVINAIQFNLIARMDDAGPRTIAPVHRTSGGTQTAGTTSANLTANYLDQLSVNEVSLATGTAWTAAEVNGSQFGVKVIT